MSSQENESDAASSLSALMDGQVGAAEVKALCEAWGQDSRTRQDWHLYQLIGDSLRSDELAQAPAHDRQFLDRLSARLAQEPVVLAPQARTEDAAELPQQSQRALVHGSSVGRLRWSAPVAIAAGFMLVAGALVVVQNNGAWHGDVQQGSKPSLVLARSETRPAGAAPMPEGSLTQLSSDPGHAWSGAAGPASAPRYGMRGPLVRDARLDRYLQAHKEFGAGTALGVSTGYLRNASYDAPQP